MARRAQEDPKTYVDGFVAAVPTANRDAYLAHARQTAPLFRSAGALSVTEAWGNDVPEGKLTSLSLAVKAKPDESIVMSWVTWPDRATRDAGWARLTGDPAMQNLQMPFDGARLIYGGFEVILQA